MEDHPQSAEDFPQSAEARPSAAPASASSSSRDPWSRMPADIDDNDGTTLVMRNLPMKLEMEQLVAILDDLGFGDRYDLLYLPTSNRKQDGNAVNLGYCFVNFVRAECADAFRGAFEGYRFEGSKARKPGTTELANTQGFMKCMETIRMPKSLVGQCLKHPRGSLLCRV